MDINAVQEHFLPQIPAEPFGYPILHCRKGQLIDSLENHSVQSRAESRPVDALAGGSKQHRHYLIPEMPVRVAGERNPIAGFIRTSRSARNCVKSEWFQYVKIGHNIALIKSQPPKVEQ